MKSYVIRDMHLKIEAGSPPIVPASGGRCVIAFTTPSSSPNNIF